MDSSPTKAIIFGEGAVHPSFIGCVYMKDNSESHEAAALRFFEAMLKMGFEWQGVGK